MCGIAGFVNDMPIDVNARPLQRMTDIIAHRGPNGATLLMTSMWLWDIAEHHRSGRRPAADLIMRTVLHGHHLQRRNLHYQPLRDELIAAGHAFTTKSDTEVPAPGYEQWGVDLLQRVGACSPS